MGEAAALQFYLENKSWISSTDEAYKILYPDRSKGQGKGRDEPQKTRCPRCKRRFKSGVGVLQHMSDVHRNGKGVRAAREHAKVNKIGGIPPHVQAWIENGDKCFVTQEAET